MPRIQRILETALYVQDLERAANWYREVFGFAEMFSNDRLIALDVAPHSVLLLFKKGASDSTTVVPGGVIPPHDGGGRLHFALAVAGEDLEEWRDILEQKGVPLESEVSPRGGGHSLYLRDPDGNLVELAAPGIWSNDPKR